jgi:ribosomal protein S18 acetylase RimI-like enzyme
MNELDLEHDQGTPPIQILRREDASHLRPSWWSNIDTAGIQKLLSIAPGASVWMPGEGEYLLVGHWRHRPEVLNVVELVAIRFAEELLSAAISQAKTSGARVLLAIEMSERRSPAFYERAGMELLETVISWEIALGRSLDDRQGALEIDLIDSLDGGALPELVAIDWNAFPWLWRNSEDEFRDYFSQAGVEIHVLRQNSMPIGYIGMSVFPGWGHIDRLAVVRGKQGSGYGRALTQFGLRRLRSLGATRVGLSTQLRNTRSQDLYAHMGFRRQGSGDYRIYGCPLWQNDTSDDLVMGAM